MTIRLNWQPNDGREVVVARESFASFRARGYVAKDRDGNFVEFDPQLGCVWFTLPPSWMDRLDQIGDDDDEEACPASAGHQG